MDCAATRVPTDAGLILGLAFVIGAPILAFFALRRCRNGVFWREPLLDRALPPLDVGTPEEWTDGRGALGGGVAGSAALRESYTRAMWHEAAPSTALADLSWRVDPNPAPGALKKATTKGLKPARQSLPGRGEGRVVGDLRRLAGPGRVTVRLVVRGQADDVKPWARVAEEAFARAFEDQMGRGHRVRREG